jgi:hypothetical protein
VAQVLATGSLPALVPVEVVLNYESGMGLKRRLRSYLEFKVEALREFILSQGASART